MQMEHRTQKTTGHAKPVRCFCSRSSHTVVLTQDTYIVPGEPVSAGSPPTLYYNVNTPPPDEAAPPVPGTSEDGAAGTEVPASIEDGAAPLQPTAGTRRRKKKEGLIPTTY